MHPASRRTDGILVAAVVLSAGVTVAAVLVGTRSIAWLAVLRGLETNVDADIVWRIRLPRVCLGFVSGAVLAVSGLALQAVFRNPLATPYTLGISSGASVGAALYMAAGLTLAIGSVSGLSLAAWLSAAGATALVFALTHAGRGFSTATLLLTGVALSFFFSSVVLAIQYVGDVATSFRVGRWLMGGLEVVGFAPLWQLAPFAAAGLLTVVGTRRELDLLALGDEAAASRGVAVTRVKVRVLIAVSTMVAGVVAICGPIGFVGLIVPHVGRLVIGPRHDRLVLLALFGGGAFLVLCDTAARTVLAPVEIPVGIVTALLGGPFFLMLLLRQRARLERERGVT
jgi:iron complex transport system permease protein